MVLFASTLLGFPLADEPHCLEPFIELFPEPLHPHDVVELAALLYWGAERLR